MKNFILDRKYIKSEYTIGDLFLDGDFICNIIEDKVRDYNKDGDLDDGGEEKIYGETAIPYGRYKIDLTYSPKFRRMLPILLRVPHFTGIRIHGTLTYVATQKHTHGCLIPGENKVRGGVIRSKYYEELITDIVKKTIYDDKEEVYINIT